jgi:cytochrome c oxidase subunit 3
MWLFLSTEVLVFGALFTGYVVYRLSYPLAFEEASRHLSLGIAAANTVVLLTSSLTMALAVRAAQVGQRRYLTLGLAATVLLGVLFLAIKAAEYAIDYREGLVPGLAFYPEDWRGEPADADADHVQHIQLFLVFYYILTGLHALHMIVGISVVAVLAVLAWRGAYAPDYYAPVEAWGLYWHFVDVVWIFLLPLLYLVGTRTS